MRTSQRAVREIVFYLTFLMILGCNGSGGDAVQPDKPLRLPGPDDKLIPYEVLKQKSIKGNADEPRDMINLDVLVTEKATKQEVMKLAEWLREKNEGRGLILAIFDSKEVWESLTPPDSPEQLAIWNRKFTTKQKVIQMEKKYKLHYLAGMGVDTDGKVMWTAEGRNH